MTYETITVQELPNRASNAYHAGDCGIPETPNQFFAILHRQADGSWWNIFESAEEQTASEELAKLQKQDAAIVATFAQSKKPALRAKAVPAEFKLVLVVAKQAEPVIEEPVQVEEVQEVVAEQSVEAVEASTDEQVEVAESGKFEVEVSAVGKPFTAYRGDSLETAKSTVADHIGKCLRVQTRVHLSSSESFWVYPGKRANGLAWDSHEQWLADLHAGKFDTAYARDYVNDLVLQGKQNEAKREANWFQERGINV